MNVLSDNRRELSSSHKANGIPAQTTKSGQLHILIHNHFTFPPILQMGAAFRIHPLSIKARESGDALGLASNVRPEVTLRADERAGQKVIDQHSNG